MVTIFFVILYNKTGMRMSKYKNQQDYENAKKSDYCEPQCNACNLPAPKPHSKNSLNCNLHCEGTQVSFNIDDHCKSFTIKQTRNR